MYVHVESTGRITNTVILRPISGARVIGRIMMATKSSPRTRARQEYLKETRFSVFGDAGDGNTFDLFVGRTNIKDQERK